MMNLKKEIHKVKTRVMGIIMHRGKNTVLDEVRKNIVRVREPGGQPRADFLTFDSYMSCTGIIKLSKETRGENSRSAKK